MEIDPHVLSVKYSMRRYYADSFLDQQAQLFLPSSNVIDVGGVRVRKRGQFDIDNYPVQVTAVNLVRDKTPDVQSDATALPFAANQFDIAICTEVLEHVPDPDLVIREMYRVLRVGGKTIITVPFLYRLHGDPYDYGRYTETFWRNHLQEAGFQIETLTKQGLFWSVAVDMYRELIKQRVDDGKLGSRLWRGLAVRSMAWARRKAIENDRSEAVQQHPVMSSYTTGFGIVACR